MGDQLLTPPEVAALLGMTTGALANKRYHPEHYGPGPGFKKVGRLVRYPLAEVERWIGDTHDRTPVPDRGRRRAS